MPCASVTTVTVGADGAVTAGGRQLAVVTPGRWSHVEIRFNYGPGAPKSYAITLSDSDGETKSVTGVPFASDQFTTCTWFGVSSLDNDKAIYYLDNIRMAIDGSPEQLDSMTRRSS